MMERKTRYEVRIACCRIWRADGSMEIYYYEDLELWYRDKIKGTVRPEVEFDEALQEAFYKRSS